MAEITPPITTVAKGRWTSAPMPVPKAMGINPRLATKVVIKTGRNRIMAASSTAFSRDLPALRSCLTVLTKSISSRTATPERAINPIPAEMEKGISLNQRARIPPTQANGTPVNTRKVSRTLP